jgi:hypothetical protein
LSFLLLFIPVAYALEKYGIRICITCAMISTTIGLWLCYAREYINKDNLAGGLVMEGAASILVGVAMPFILNSLTKMSATWFGPKGRNIATMVILLCFYAPEAI